MYYSYSEAFESVGGLALGSTVATVKRSEGATTASVHGRAALETAGSRVPPTARIAFARVEQLQREVARALQSTGTSQDARPVLSDGMAFPGDEAASEASTVMFEIADEEEQSNSDTTIDLVGEDEEEDNSDTTMEWNAEHDLYESPSSSEDEEVCEALACTVCFSRRRSMVFMPCRHMCTCRSCYRNLGVAPMCPICRQAIETVVTHVIIS